MCGALLDGVGKKQTVGLQIIDAEGTVVSEAWAIAAAETKLTAFVPDCKALERPGGCVSVPGKASDCVL